MSLWYKTRRRTSVEWSFLRGVPLCFGRTSCSEEQGVKSSHRRRSQQRMRNNKRTYCSTKMATTTGEKNAPGTTDSCTDDVEKICIVGGGIVGLVLALALDKIGVTASVYEREPAFHDDVGAGQGMYSNGLRVIRDISPELLERIRQAGFPYVYRRWERHDGTVVAVANETVLSNDDDEIQSIGIRRWRLLKVLYETVVEAGIPVHFNKKLKHVEQARRFGAC